MNINHCRTAQDLLIVNSEKLEADMVVIAEPYRVMENWFADAVGKAAIYITSRGINKARNISIYKSEEGFVVIKYNDFYIISVYASPNAGRQRFEEMLTKLEMLLRTPDIKERVLVMGDFNAKSPLWGSDNWCGRGKVLYEMCCASGLCPIILAGGVTCDRGQGTKIDILFVNDGFQQGVTESNVLQEYTASDHRYVLHLINAKVNTLEEHDPFDLGKGKLDAEGFLSLFLNKYGDENSDRLGRTYTTLEIDRFISDLNKMTNKNMKFTKNKVGKREPVPWWNKVIAAKKEATNKAKRKYTRLRARGDDIQINEAHVAYKTCKRELNFEIRKAKRENWYRMLQEIEKDIWGRPYKSVIKRVKGMCAKPDVLGPEEIEEVVKKMFIMKPEPGTETLIYAENRTMASWTDAGTVESTVEPEKEERVRILIDENTYLDEPAGNALMDDTGGPGRKNRNEVVRHHGTYLIRKLIFSADEIRKVAASMSAKKAPGPDGITAAVAKDMGMRAAKWFSYIFSCCYNRGYWPVAWKTGRLVLLPKGKAKSIEERAFRPLSIISCVAKILEKVLKSRILAELKMNDLSHNQYGFRKGRPTLDAMVEIKNLWEKAKSEGRHCLLVMLDVKNAFNSLKWSSIIKCMKKRRFSKELIGIIDSYLQERYIKYECKDSVLAFQVFGGVPQGSVIGPLLWNIVYDDLLRMRLRRDVHLIGYADDIGIVIIEKELAVMQRLAACTIDDLGRW